MSTTNADADERDKEGGGPARALGNARTAARALVDQLVINGVATVYCVPGESYLSVLDALWQRRQSVRVVQCRHEAAAANMAEAIGKLTGRPGICMVTRGPGATHASTGVHTARQDSSPMILFIGQVARGASEREAFQEIDYRAMFGKVAKWTTEIDDPARVPEVVQRAFAVAMSGRPGPVVVALPEDMLGESCFAADSAPSLAVRSAPSPAAMLELGRLLADAAAPIAIVGGGGWNTEACLKLTEFSRRSGLPVAAAFRCQSLVDNEMPSYVGHLGVGADPALLKAVRGADLVLAMGTRLEETVSQGYTLFDIPGGQQRLVHIHPDPDELGRVYRPRLAICSGMPEFVDALSALAVEEKRWTSAAASARADYEASVRPSVSASKLDLGAVMAWIRERLPDDAIVTNGAGNYAIWVHKFLRWRRPGTQLAPTSGAMGYGIPAAVAAKLHDPARMVLAFAGDGCFLMSGHELATAMQHNAPIIVIVVNNGMYGTIRMHQERRFPGHVIATQLQNPDFVMYAQSFGCHSERVERTEEFAPAFERAAAAGRPAVIELIADPAVLAPPQPA